MNTPSISVAKGPPKTATGISGLDEVTGGGLPHGRTTLLVGGPGSGKTILSLQFLVHGATKHDEPGIFVAFEESADRIVANAEGFGWNLPELRQGKIVFIDAQPSPDLVHTGSFDLGGLIAVLEAQTLAIGARRIVFDSLDMLLSLLPDAAAKRREVYRLHNWLLDNQLTGIITAKAGVDHTATDFDQTFGFMQFMVDCAIILKHHVVQGVSQRNLRVQKYRGTSFDENESPIVIGHAGFEVAVARPLARGIANVSKQRVSTGVERLDTMLGGGYYRGASVVITGFPGTAKTTLSGAFSEAACERGDRTMFVSFDADSNEVVRDLSSVGIRLDRHIDSGLLRMISARTVSGSAEAYLVRIKAQAKEHHSVCVVIDPVSTLTKSSDGLSAYSMAERIIDWAKTEGITLLCTSLIDELSLREEGVTSLQISKLADTWIHVDYLVQAGERNRGLSIIKSRGTSHSNQVRELILSNDGVTLADTYTAGGEVLMGTLRWQKENEERAASERAEVAGKLKRVQLDAEEAELQLRIKSLNTELIAKQVEKALLSQTTASHEEELSVDDNRMRELRGADVPAEKES